MITEESVLTSFLLNSELADNLSLKQFTNLFPVTYRNNPLIKTLYREFQLERNTIRETVKANIIEECRKPEQWENLEDNMEVDDDIDEPYDEFEDNRLSLKQAISILSKAKRHMTYEIYRMNEDFNELFEGIENSKNELSDLVYGRIPKEGFGKDDAIDGLKALTKSCNDMLEINK
ncbi:hypothetical protein RhiirA1_407178 [Rhizophagus irregularis]|uniref:Uncharacterized protein n=3 Tax=Rhizophagus irregularis TaxID=588596 RepID=U9TLW8_RHIID|nr:hypothetical protein GLOIN_2v1686754 [Rhizophagus irregularis DAOM 181602=DAOM 197198]EXX72650.1 hypothetical protein RirG_067350 [Rhizophagus irregularis DAOM 197198w]PKC75810.1 hypothetical protein RhiirA1_407178 [Rhizophagus irregularis]PKY14281.1 hypothetical protein RhiirB3_400072 [Rhizophagus irregularis]POG63398.1 hypothetical protein GLOIN_2v1686754 [Rhizophagus irregularis DAOM 181602=DAOM 197198]UZO28103.1 hypothetical protein OCT59_021646 [Rhizophagus irregularis]|eukprot:XP_025170264.1 hypothetical protein GLOIN_2v1686754 [Rhizophagus irregularis DAOM 181602=DAOM 197198]